MTSAFAAAGFPGCCSTTTSRQRRIASPALAWRCSRRCGRPASSMRETAGTIQGERHTPLNGRRRLDDDQIRTYGRKMTALAEWCDAQGMPIAYHHHMAAPIETEQDLDLLMRHSGEALMLDLRSRAHGLRRGRRAAGDRQSRASHPAFPRQGYSGGGGERPRPFAREFPRCGPEGRLHRTPATGSLDFAAPVQRMADNGYEGWFVVEAEQDPAKAPPTSTRGSAMPTWSGAQAGRV